MASRCALIDARTHSRATHAFLSIAHSLSFSCVRNTHSFCQGSALLAGRVLYLVHIGRSVKAACMQQALYMTGPRGRRLSQRDENEHRSAQKSGDERWERSKPQRNRRTQGNTKGLLTLPCDRGFQINYQTVIPGIRHRKKSNHNNTVCCYSHLLVLSSSLLASLEAKRSIL